MENLLIKRISFLPAVVTIILFNINVIFSQTAVLKGDLLIKNVNVVDVKKGTLIKNQNILITGKQITAIASSVKNLIADKNIDCSGKFIIPGLWDMHTHNWWQLHFSNYYIGNGVLGVRNMYTPMSMIKPVKDSIANGTILGPYYYAAGRVIEGPKPEFPDWLVVDKVEKIKSALDTLQMEGSDFVKVYNKIPKEVYFELVKEAKNRGLKVEGHVPMSVSVIDASNAGQKSFEHLLGIPDICTSEPLFKNKYENNWFAAVMNSDDYGKLVIDEKLASKNFEVLRKNNSYICPTLVVWYNYFHPDELFENDPNVKKFSNDIAGFWNGEIVKYRNKDQSYKQMMINKYNNLKKVTNLLYKSGVPLLTGTDVINPYVYPGYSLHKELVLLKECGIPDAEILKMATLNAAEFLEISDNYGSVEKEKIASLVILEDNPLKDISNTKKIESVILNGKLINRKELDKLLK